MAREEGAHSGWGSHTGQGRPEALSVSVPAAARIAGRIKARRAVAEAKHARRTRAAYRLESSGDRPSVKPPMHLKTLVSPNYSSLALTPGAVRSWREEQNTPSQQVEPLDFSRAKPSAAISELISRFRQGPPRSTAERQDERRLIAEKFWWAPRSSDIDMAPCVSGSLECSDASYAGWASPESRTPDQSSIPTPRDEFGPVENGDSGKTVTKETDPPSGTKDVEQVVSPILAPQRMLRPIDLMRANMLLELKEGPPHPPTQESHDEAEKSGSDGTNDVEQVVSTSLAPQNLLRPIDLMRANLLLELKKGPPHPPTQESHAEIEKSGNDRGSPTWKEQGCGRKRIRVLWDIENVSIPSRKSPFGAALALQRVAISLAGDLWPNETSEIPCRTYAFHNPLRNTLKPSVRKELVGAFVTLIDVGQSKIGSADLQINQELDQIAQDFVSSDVLIVMVSSDSDFVPVLRRLKAQGYSVASIRRNEGHASNAAAMYDEYTWRVLDWESDVMSSVPIKAPESPKPQMLGPKAPKSKRKAHKAKVAARNATQQGTQSTPQGQSVPEPGPFLVCGSPNPISRSSSLPSTTPCKIHAKNEKKSTLGKGRQSKERSNAQTERHQSIKQHEQCPNMEQQAQKEHKVEGKRKRTQRAGMDQLNEDRQKEAVNKLKQDLYTRLLGTSRGGAQPPVWMPSMEMLHTGQQVMRSSLDLEDRIRSEMKRIQSLRSCDNLSEFARTNDGKGSCQSNEENGTHVEPAQSSRIGGGTHVSKERFSAEYLDASKEADQGRHQLGVGSVEIRKRLHLLREEAEQSMRKLYSSDIFKKN